MMFPQTKNRIKFTRKKKCDVCKKEKKVGFECEDCYNKGFEITQKTIWEMAQEDIFEGVIKILAEHPRSDMYGVNGTLVSADSVIKGKIEKLLGRPIGGELLKRYAKGWEDGKKETTNSWNGFILRFKTELDLLQHDSATLGICEKDDVEKIIDKLSPKFQSLTGEFSK